MSLEYGIDRTTVGIAPENNRLAARCRASGAFRLRLHDLSAPPSSPAAGPRSPSRPSPAGRRPVRADTRQTLQGPQCLTGHGSRLRPSAATGLRPERLRPGERQRLHHQRPGPSARAAASPLSHPTRTPAAGLRRQAWRPQQRHTGPITEAHRSDGAGTPWRGTAGRREAVPEQERRARRRTADAVRLGSRRRGRTSGMNHATLRQPRPYQSVR
jgi:hypothetical protein